jgi:Asp-tRNA(Asn)/Glu-tRNA(Gln) amidotransferase A subunit family amidase
MPVGARLLGTADTEAQLISLAGQLEQHERWFERDPPTSYPGPW